jgi:predicted nucleic acid-binding protein
MLVYVDSVLWIYLVEDPSELGKRARRLFARLAAEPADLAITDLVRLECLVGPLRHGRADDLTAFRLIFGREEIQKLPLTELVFDRAAEIRATHRLEIADAIHLAAAVEGGCDRFLTNDARLGRFPGISVELLP